MPDELVRAVLSRTGTSGFSQYVTAAVSRRNAHDQLGDLITELIAEHGPPAGDLMRQARSEWPDYESD
jgi:hypothetical protein